MDKQSASPASGITKWYYRPQLESLLDELKSVQDLAPTAAEEWKKGLENARHEQIADAMRFERWEFSGGWNSSRAALKSGTSKATAALLGPSLSENARLKDLPPAVSELGKEILLSRSI